MPCKDPRRTDLTPEDVAAHTRELLGHAAG